MDIRIIIQSTPNPNALKFVLNVPVKTEGNVTYKKSEDCAHNPLAQSIFNIHKAIKEVYFFDNYITVTQDGSVDWEELEDKLRKDILDKAAAHDPNFKVIEPKKTKVTIASLENPEIARINAILDETVRPALQMDGGDIQIVDYSNNKVKVFYQGACGSCPSSSMGTMQAIENILKDQFNPEISVELAESM